ncbi:hypothetical protein ALC57_10929 [Trachymyrmex cornetzi]|uniref:Uncharacterized protein n=1 Tax=Trachymyrmex cornetzi TaxID=471704 RepID=A0A195DVF7_9HYME|nr:hypothetical protein ALC57_10929 [Trachymyrmex cornetzi]
MRKVRNKVFTNPEGAESLENLEIEEEAVPSNDFVNDLFRDQAQTSEAASWLPIVLDTTRADVRTGLKVDLKKCLLAKYEPKEELSFLAPPKINKEIRPNLGATVIARDNHQSQAQRAFIVPSLNFLGKMASDAAPVDDFLFGTNFREEVDAAQTTEKVASRMAKKTQRPTAKGTQPVTGQHLRQQKS